MTITHSHKFLLHDPTPIFYLLLEINASVVFDSRDHGFSDIHLQCIKVFSFWLVFELRRGLENIKDCLLFGPRVSREKTCLPKILSFHARGKNE